MSSLSQTIKIEMLLGNLFHKHPETRRKREDGRREVTEINKFQISSEITSQAGMNINHSKLKTESMFSLNTDVSQCSLMVLQSTSQCAYAANNTKPKQKQDNIFGSSAKLVI